MRYRSLIEMVKIKTANNPSAGGGVEHLFWGAR